jgi:hypothetical protein
MSFKFLIDSFLQFWYLWLLVAATGVLSLFAPKIKGHLGEKSVALFLSRLDQNKYKVINNIMLKIDNKTSQIDHVVVSNYGVFVIETKNYKGFIIGNEYDEYWKQVIYKRKEKLYNPIRQNYGHVQALKEVLSDYTGIHYIPIVVFTTKADLKVTSSSEVIYSINLLKTIRKHTVEQISDGDRDGIFLQLKSLNVDNKENRKNHIKRIENGITEKKDKVESGICPRCGGRLIEKSGKYGKFMGCSGYPRCRFTGRL